MKQTNRARHMLRRCLLCCGFAAAFAACSQQPSTGYVITGTADGTVDGDTVYLCDMEGFFALTPVDTTVIKDGKFEFTGNTEGAAMRFLVPIHDGQPTAMTMIVLENTAIKATIKGRDEEAVIEGGPSQKLYNEFEEATTMTSQKMDEPLRVVNDSAAGEAAKKAAQRTIDSLQQVQRKYAKDFIIAHVPSPISDMLFGMCMQEFSEQEQEEILKILGEKQPQYPVYKSLMAERQASEATSVGSHYTDIALPGTDGKTVKVSDYVEKNKYTLVDFWASWCGPCRAEMPTVVKAYKDFHSKGFEVVGVSLDNDKEAWLKAIGQLNMPWPQMSDLKGWECEGAQTYNIRSIPANVLIDQQGKIVAKDLRGEDLLSKMAELMP